MEIIGSSDGIVCLQGLNDWHYYGWNPLDDWDISLWNPLTKRAKRLLRKDPNIHRKSLGFGFDSFSSDYKFVRIVYGWKNSDDYRKNSVDYCVKVYMYSANADAWREIQIKEKLKVLDFTTCVPIFKGVLYWMSMDRMGLVSFVLHDEVFGKIPFPGCLLWHNIPDVVIYKDSVALISYEYYDDETISDIPKTSLWTMDDGIGNVSWTKKFTFEATLEIERVYSYLRTGQFAAKKVWGGGFFLYDNENKVAKNVQVPGWRQDGSVFNYVESLVSI